MVGMSYQMPTNGGIIRGSGSIAYSMKVDLISTWGIVIPLSMFMAFVVKASPAVSTMMKAAGFTGVQIVKDLPGLDRVVLGQKQEEIHV